MSVTLSPLIEEPDGTPAAHASGKESSALFSSSPADDTGKRRTRASSRALLKTGSQGSPEKTYQPADTTQPARKVSKMSITLRSQEHL